MTHSRKSISALAAVVALSFAIAEHVAVAQGALDLEKSFVNPPESAKPSGYWWWLNANIDKEAITRDMNEFRAKGMGSVLLVCSGNWCGPDDVRGPAFLSDEWRELYRFAIKEAHRVGIKVDVNIAPGWNMGGPWVTPDKACRWFLQSETNVIGPQKLSLKLPLPGVKDGYDSRPQLGVRYSMKLLFEEVDYRDTAVVAFRTPKGGRPAARADLPAKSNRKDANCFIASEKVMSQTLGPWTVTPEDRPIKETEVVDLTARMRVDGTLDWDMPEGEWTIVRTGHRMTGAQLSVPMRGQGGLENDYFDRAGIDLMFEKVGKILIEDAGPLAGTTLRGFCEDSFEAGYPNWTANMLKHFKRYRGYDPTPYLPVFKGWIVGSAEISERFLHDYRKTVADCFADEHYGRMNELCRPYNMVTRCESAGPSWSGTVCMDGLKNLGRAEIPQGEFWQDNCFVENGQNKVTKMAASAAHIYGKRMVAAEAFTDGNPGSKDWRVPVSRLKPTVDRAFCEGINQCVFCIMTCQKPSEGKPGLDYGAGTHFNPNVTWWDQAAGSWIGYINRCQALLQSGLFVADVLYYNGDWAPNLVGPKQIDQPGLGKGYDYDVCNAEVLLTRLSVKDGRIVLPDGMSYRVLVLPETKRMPVEVVKKISDLVKAGATIVGPRPESDPGLNDYPACDAEVLTLGLYVWGACDGQQVKQNSYGKGRVFWGKTVGEIFQSDHVLPDFTYTNNAFIDFIHRRADGAEIYFLVNRKNQKASIDATFRVEGMQPELWDPVSGQRLDLKVFKSKDGQTTVPLEFEPDGSMFVVFRNRSQKSASSAKATEAMEDRSQNGQKNFTELKPVQEITGAWTVQFDSQWFYPTDGLIGDQAKGLMTFDKLEDWTQRPEQAVKYYSGTAVYKKAFGIQESVSSSGKGLFLDLGTVKETAKVKLNGKDLGVVWCHPWRVEITGAIKPGENQLEIEVVNLWPNRLIGDTTLTEAQRRTRTNKTTDPKGKLLPSGLLGPVQILTQSHE
jgi:alpha-L-rhamnosidase